MPGGSDRRRSQAPGRANARYDGQDSRARSDNPLLTSMTDSYSGGPSQLARRHERQRQSLYPTYTLTQDRATDERQTSAYSTNASRGPNSIPDRTLGRGVSPYPRSSEVTGDFATSSSRQALPNPTGGSSSSHQARRRSTSRERRAARLVSFADRLPRQSDRRPEGHYRSGESGATRRSENGDRLDDNFSLLVSYTTTSCRSPRRRGQGDSSESADSHSHHDRTGSTSDLGLGYGYISAVEFI
ncbi:uncharacterized protein B0T15DRAFT_549239 [Chaetomium strumarium]|uniref:Uncharacterized protein n=1 Tax=Chaetomium strumarium TaxID=1170767 RepID=A0AAJ0H4G9_9PEZI|nr:hypothetical protein B0T15DRAFT_549239 [Chaetomium strumarium]